jgi:predicted kinase
MALATARNGVEGEPLAVVVCGDAGTGKTTYGKRLARHLRATVIDIDTCTEAVVRAGLRAAGMHEDDRDSSAFKSAFRLPIHEALFAIARDQLCDARMPVVIIAPLTQERKRQDFVQFLQRSMTVRSSSPQKDGASDVRVFVVHVICDAVVRRQRIIARGNPRDALKFDPTSGYFAQVPGGEGEVLPCQHIRINTTACAAPSLDGPWSTSSVLPSKL